MVHYFSEDNDNLKSNPKVIALSIKGTQLKLNTDDGVFSKNNLDRGTNVLLKYLELKESHKTVLDLGCGYGVIGIYISKVLNISVDLVDINKRAINLALKNIVLNKVNSKAFLSNGFSNVSNKYDLIITNPPIRAGKDIIYRFFDDSAKYLKPDGEFYIVINKKHGAQSAINKLQTIYKKVEVLKREKGFSVIKCKNPLTI